jgi:hypothetical protein
MKKTIATLILMLLLPVAVSANQNSGWEVSTSRPGSLDSKTYDTLCLVKGKGAFRNSYKSTYFENGETLPSDKCNAAQISINTEKKIIYPILMTDRAALENSDAFDVLNAERPRILELRRKKYLAAFEAAKTFEAISAFEKTYADNDPDGLIEKLQMLYEALWRKEYMSDFEKATNPDQWNAFIEKYSAEDQDDPDGLIPKAKEKIAQVEARIKKEREEAEELLKIAKIEIETRVRIEEEMRVKKELEEARIKREQEEAARKRLEAAEARTKREKGGVAAGEEMDAAEAKTGASYKDVAVLLGFPIMENENEFLETMRDRGQDAECRNKEDGGRQCIVDNPTACPITGKPCLLITGTYRKDGSFYNGFGYQMGTIRAQEIHEKMYPKFGKAKEKTTSNDLGAVTQYNWQLDNVKFSIIGAILKTPDKITAHTLISFDVEKPTPKAQQKQAAADKQKEEKKGGEDEAKDNMRKLADGHAKYSNRIFYSSDQARKIVESFTLKCREGKILYLVSVLYASMEDYEIKYGTKRGVFEAYEVENRGDNIRIYRSHMNNKMERQLGSGRLFYTINEWGELKSPAMSGEIFSMYFSKACGDFWVPDLYAY